MEQAEKATSGKPKNRSWILWLLALIPASGIFLHYQDVPLLGDAGAFAGIAEHMNHGQVLYRDVWDNKAPGIFFLFRFFLFLGQGSTLTFHIVQALFIFLCIGILWQLIYSFHRRSIWIAILMVPLMLLLFTEWAYYFCGHYTEEYGCYFLFFSAAIFQLSQRKENGVDIWAIVAGMLAASAVLIKEPFAPALLLMAAFVWKNSHIKTLLYFISGAAFPVILFVLYLTLNQAWTAYFNYLQFAFSYASDNVSKMEIMKQQWATLLGNWELRWHIYPVFLLIGLVPAFVNKMHVKNKQTWWLILLLFISANIFLIVSKNMYGHYILPVVFFGSIMFVFGLIELLNIINRFRKKMKWPAVLRFIPVLVILIWIYKPLKESLHYLFSEKYPLNISEKQEKASIIQKLGDARTVFVDVQDMGRVYPYAGKISGQPFPSPYYIYFTQEGKTNQAEENIKRLVNAFKQNPPDALITSKTMNAGFVRAGVCNDILMNYNLHDSMVVIGDAKVYFYRKR